MNFTQCIYIYLLATSLFCNGADQQLAKYKSIPFNRGVIEEPSSMRCITGKTCAIAGDTGFEIQTSDQTSLNIFKRSPGPWRLAKDAQTIVAFNKNEIYITDLGGERNSESSLKKIIFEPFAKEHIADIAIDSVKNIIFIGYNRPGRNSEIIQHPYDSGRRRYYYKDDDSSLLSVALSGEKDVLCTLDNYSEINLRKTSDMKTIFKTIKLKASFDCYRSCMFNHHDGNLIVRGINNAYVLDWLNDPATRKTTIDSITYDSICDKLDCSGDSATWINLGVAFHPCGLLAVLLSSYPGNISSSIQYWDTRLLKKIDTTTVSGVIAQNLCFRYDGLELAIAGKSDCIAMPVSLEVIKHYIVPSLWMKLKTVQKQYDLPQDVIKHCIHTLIAYSQSC